MSIMAALPFIGKILDRVIPDKNSRAAAQELLESAAQKGELDLLVGQMKVNMVEAAHDNMFVAGWRPFVGWTCGIGLFYNFILYPFLSLLIVVLMEDPPELPQLDAAQLLALVTGMLGLAGSRSWEKGKGVHRDS